MSVVRKRIEELLAQNVEYSKTFPGTARFEDFKAKGRAKDSAIVSVGTYLVPHIAPFICRYLPHQSSNLCRPTLYA
jgi:hypothetical protein